MIKKQNHAETETDAVRNLQKVWIAVLLARHHFVKQDVYVPHADIFMKVHDSKAGTDEQEQPDADEQYGRQPLFGYWISTMVSEPPTVWTSRSGNDLCTASITFITSNTTML